MTFAVYRRNEIANNRMAPLPSAVAQFLTRQIPGATTADACRPILDSFLETRGCRVVQIWSVDPRRRKLILISEVSLSSIPGERKLVLDFDTSLNGQAAVTRQIIEFNLSINYAGCSFSDHSLMAYLQEPLRDHQVVPTLTSIPVNNIGNPHQVEYILSLYDSRDFNDTPINFGVLGKAYASNLSTIIEHNLRERTFRMATSASRVLGEFGVLNPSETFPHIASFILAALHVDHVSLYLDDWNDTLTHRHTAIASSKTARSESSIPSPVLAVKDKKREYVMTELDNEVSELDVSGDADIRSALIVPMHTVHGGCRGVIVVALHRNGNYHRNDLLTYDDIALIEAIVQAFAPALDALREAERRNVQLQKLAHELRVPVVAFRAVLERMEAEYLASTFRFKYRHFQELGIYVDQFSRQVEELDIARIGPSNIPLNRQPTSLLSDIVIPTMRFIRPLLRKRGFKFDQLHNDIIGSLPEVSIDRALITQVLFNLLENAIKYFPKSRLNKEFRCDISGRIKDGGYVEVSVSDNGDGVASNDIPRLFSFGFRGRMAKQYDVQGGGLGLWISRGVVERHGGSLEYNPNGKVGATFLMSIPYNRYSYIS